MTDKIDLFIIDDDPIIIEELKIILADYQLKTRTFTDANEALLGLQMIIPKIIFLNYSMSQMNGDQFIIRMSEKCLFRGTSVYLLTDMNFPPTKTLQLQTLGFSSIIKKPLLEKDILAAISETIDLQLKKISA